MKKFVIAAVALATALVASAASAQQYLPYGSPQSYQQPQQQYAAYQQPQYYPQQPGFRQGMQQGMQQAVGDAALCGTEAVLTGFVNKLVNKISGSPSYYYGNGMQQCMYQQGSRRQQETWRAQQRADEEIRARRQLEQQMLQQQMAMAPKCTYREQGRNVTRECQGTKFESAWMESWEADISGSPSHPATE